MELETERLILRPWEDKDATELYRYAKDPAVGPIAGWPPHTSVENSLDIIHGILSEPETYAVVLKETGKPVGSVGIMRMGNGSARMTETEAEIGYWIGVPYWGRGLIPEAVNELLRRCFEDLGCTAVWCGYYNGNLKSKRVQEKCGFIYHHTRKNIPCPMTHDIRDEHFTCITKDAWLAKQLLLTVNEDLTMNTEKITYPKSKKYNSEIYNQKIMGPNPIKLEEELMLLNRTPAGAKVCDLGSGQGVTSVFLAKEYGFRVYAADLWSDPDENRNFFRSVGINDDQITPVKADASALPFEKESFDAVVSTDSYNYFGRDPLYLDSKLLPFVKKGGYVYIAIPGMKKDCHDNLPEVLLLSWNAEQLEYMHDVNYWRNMVGLSKDAEIISVEEMKSNDEVWADWLRQENEYAIGDRKTMEAGGGKYLNFISIVLRKK